MHSGKIHLLASVAIVLLSSIGCTQAKNKSQITQEAMKSNEGRVEGIVTSADDVGKPLPNVLIQLKYQPFVYDNPSTEAIATTKTDVHGRFVFENVEAGVYFPQATIPRTQGDCIIADAAIFIQVKAGSVVNVNLSYSCP